MLALAVKVQKRYKATKKGKGSGKDKWVALGKRLSETRRCEDTTNALR